MNEEEVREVDPELVWDDDGEEELNDDELQDLTAIDLAIAEELKREESEGSWSADQNGDWKEEDEDEAISTSLVPRTNESSLAATHPMTKYLQEIQRYPLLSKEEEYALAVRFREEGDQSAAEKLVTSNLRFVVKIAAEYARFGSKLIDLVQEGNVGLMHAVREYNPYRGVRLISYAVWWIRGYIKEYLLRQQSLVRIGSNAKQKKLFHQLRREERKLELLGKEPDLKALALRLDVSEEDVSQMQQRLRHGDLSLDRSLGQDSDTAWLDLQVDEKQELQDEALARQELLNFILLKIEDLHDSLNEKELYILEKRILEDEPVTLQEVGDRFGISRERARQLEARILKRLKEKVLQDLPLPESGY